MALRSFCQVTKDLTGKFLIGEGRLLALRGAVKDGSRSAFGQASGSGGTAHGAGRQLSSAWQRRLRHCANRVNDKVNILAVMFAKQCNAIAAQKLRRSLQIMFLYRSLGYDKNAFQKLIQTTAQNMHRRGKDKPLWLMFSAVLFSWDKNKITDEELKGVADEIKLVHHECTDGRNRTTVDVLPEQEQGQWEKVIAKDSLSLWRKPLPNSYLYEYKVYGSYGDLPARAFFNAQVDPEWRKEWDYLIIKLDVVDRDKDSGCEVVQWVMHFPFPMYSREYVYIRKTLIDPDGKVMVISSRSTDHPGCPRQSQYVRVDQYVSQMVIRPYTTFDEDGFDYILTYHDDPRSAIPSAAYSWMASTGVPDYVERMHTAAKRLHENRKTRGTQSQQVSGRIPM